MSVCIFTESCKVCGGPTVAHKVHFPLLESEDSGPGYDETVHLCSDEECDGSFL